MLKKPTIKISEFRVQNSAFEGGYAALTMMVLTLVVSLSLVGSLTFFSLKEVSINRSYTKSVESRYVSEGGIEDAVYRVVSGRQIGAQENLVVGNGSTTVSITDVGSRKIIRSEGKREIAQHNLEAEVEISTINTSFYYGIQVGAGGFSMGNNSRVNGNVYANGSIVGSNGAVITGDAVVAGGLAASPSFEWTPHNADHAFATASSNRDIAQSFSANAGGLLNRVSVYLGKVGNPTANVNVHITTDNNGKPSSSALTSSSISTTTVGAAPSWIDVSFADAPTLANGTKYWIVLDYGSDSSTNYWNWRKDTTDGYSGNTGKYTNNWTTGGASWTDVGGDLAFRVWIGGTNTRIEGVTIGDSSSGTGRANVFVSATIHGSSCPSQYCIIDNPAIQNLPISTEVIQDWRNEAEAGGVCGPPQCDSSGNLSVTDTVSIGPKKIPGNLTFSNGATLIVTGTLWVVGDITFENNCTVRLSAGYGTLSGVVVGDDDITVSNNCSFDGSGTSGSYIMLLSDKNIPSSNAITVSNNSLGVIYYAPRGRIHFSNGATAKEATAYGITLDNNAIITYESGLANIQFSSGPSGGYDIKHWKKVE